MITIMNKMCVSSRSPHLIFGKLFYWRRLAWRVLILANENYRGEPHEILVKCLKKTRFFFLRGFLHAKKEANSEL